MSLEDRIDDIAQTLRPRIENIVERFDRLLLSGVLPYKITVELDPVPAAGIPCAVCGVALSAHVLGGPHPPDAERPQKSSPPQRISEGIPENAPRRKFPTETLVERGSR